ncbi:uncharacterized protein TNCV_1772461 [Trichonephila clavipes]|nr:uncharacterized protein TNCV_1772461 [Trichonephila clavipes]
MHFKLWGVNQAGAENVSERTIRLNLHYIGYACRRPLQKHLLLVFNKNSSPFHEGAHGLKSKGLEKGRCNKSNDGCGESNSTVPKNSADEKNCADGAKLCTNETEPSARLRLHLNESNYGEAVKFHLKCPSCKYNYTFFNSKKCDSSENYELNIRLVYAMRCIGKGAESARMFCGIMNLPTPPTKFSKYSHILLQATRETCEHSMAEAVREAVDENDGKRDLAVARW